MQAGRPSCDNALRATAPVVAIWPFPSLGPRNVSQRAAATWRPEYFVGQHGLAPVLHPRCHGRINAAPTGPVRFGSHACHPLGQRSGRRSDRLVQHSKRLPFSTQTAIQPALIGSAAGQGWESLAGRRYRCRWSGQVREPADRRDCTVTSVPSPSPLPLPLPLPVPLPRRSGQSIFRASPCARAADRVCPVDSDSGSSVSSITASRPLACARAKAAGKAAVSLTTSPWPP